MSTGFPVVIIHDQTERERPSLVRRWFGDKEYQSIMLPKDVTSADADQIARQFPEAYVAIYK